MSFLMNMAWVHHCNRQDYGIIAFYEMVRLEDLSGATRTLFYTAL